MLLSVILTSLNDPEIVNTVKSFRETAGDAIEIIVVDDFSESPVQIPPEYNARLFRNPKRIGVAPSRHFGAERARGDFILLSDAHMRCSDGWYEEAVKRLEENPTTIYNGCCLGLSQNQMSVEPFKKLNPPASGFYCGARLCIYDPTDKSVEHQIFEGKWKTHPDNAEISCVMSAIYFFPRDVFFAIGGLKSLDGLWGSDEPYLSLKSWLSGYEVRQLNTVRIGHKFRAKNDAPYVTSYHLRIYNKMLAIASIFPADMAEYLFSKFPDDHNTRKAIDQIVRKEKEIEAEFNFNQGIFLHDIEWFLKKFPDVTFAR